MAPSAHQSEIEPAASRHLIALDGVRGLAILLVLVYHLTLGMTGSGLGARLFLKLTSTGWCGVDLFFVLSGFLITGILIDARKSPHRFRNFYARRALRIFPLYYAVLIVVFVLLPPFAARLRGLALSMMPASGSGCTVRISSPRCATRGFHSDISGRSRSKSISISSGPQSSSGAIAKA